MAMQFGSKKKAGAPGKKVFAGFEYRKRDDESAIKRANRKVGGGESYFTDAIKFFTPKEGDHEIRILPPTWEDADHFGVDIWLHYGIGPDAGSYLCPQKMKGEPCPMCEERARAQKEGEDELADALTPRARVAFYLIDRKAEREGPKLWSCAATTEKEICAQAQDKKTHSVVSLDDPTEDGYDVSFTVEGSGKKTRYKAIQVDRKPSPLSDDEDQAAQWLKQIEENPIPDCLVFYDYEHLSDVLNGGVRVEEREEQSGKERSRSSSRPTGGSNKPAFGFGKKGSKAAEEEEESDEEEGDEEEEVKKKPSRKPEPVALTWDEVHALAEEELSALAEEHDIPDSDFEGCADLEEAQDVVCARLGIEKEKKGKGDIKSKLMGLSKGRK